MSFRIIRNKNRYDKRVFKESGQSVPVTVIKVEKGRVLDVITKEKRGYSAVKVGFFKLKIQN